MSVRRMADSCAASSDTDAEDWERMMKTEPLRSVLSDTEEESGDETKGGLNPVVMEFTAQPILSSKSDPQDGPGLDYVVQGGNSR